MLGLCKELVLKKQLRMFFMLFNCGQGIKSVTCAAGTDRTLRWLWRNDDAADFFHWLRIHNDSLKFADPKDRKKVWHDPQVTVPVHNLLL
jgi:hypothetical protein